MATHDEAGADRVNSTASNRQLVRSWRLFALLRNPGAGASLDKLARELGVHERTIRRDLAALQEAGIPIVQFALETGEQRWRLLKGAPCGICGRAPFKSADLRRERRDDDAKGVTA